MKFSMVNRSTLKTLDTEESFIIDAQFDVFDPILSVSSVLVIANFDALVLISSC